jgi:hypothetical protein
VPSGVGPLTRYWIGQPPAAHFQWVDAGNEVGELCLDGLLQTRPDDFMLLDALGNHDRLRAIVLASCSSMADKNARRLARRRNCSGRYSGRASAALEPLDFVLGRVNRRVLRKVEIDDQFRTVGRREELRLDEYPPFDLQVF